MERNHLKHTAKKAVVAGLLGSYISKMTTPTPKPPSGGTKHKNKRTGAVIHSLATSVSNAPAAKGYTVRGPRFSFGAARHGLLEGLKMKGSQIFCSVYGETSGQNALVPVGNTTTNAVSNVDFDPNNTVLMPPPMSLFGQSFSRFRLNKLIMEYLPAQPTSQTGQIAFAWNSDASANSLATGNYFVVQEVTNSVAGPLWEHMVLECPCDDEIRYINNSTTSGSLIPAEQRQDCPGSLYCKLATTYGSNVLIGTVRMHYDIDFFEVCPVSPETSLRRALLQNPTLRCCEHKCDARRETKEVSEPESPVLVHATSYRDPLDQRIAVVEKIMAREKSLAQAKATHLSLS